MMVVMKGRLCDGCVGLRRTLDSSIGWPLHDLLVVEDATLSSSAEAAVAATSLSLNDTRSGTLTVGGGFGVGAATDFVTTDTTTDAPAATDASDPADAVTHSARVRFALFNLRNTNAYCTTVYYIYI
jgi:hypothetical protein